MLAGIGNIFGGGQLSPGFKFPLPGMDEGSATTAGMSPADDNPINVVGDAWHPHKPTILGAIADAYLMSQGMKPAFSIERKAADETSAMQGFTDNPTRAMKRLAQIDGDGPEAWKRYNEYVDNQRLQGNLDRQNKIFDTKLEEMARDRVAGMLGAATADNYPQVLARAQGYLRAKGFSDIADSLPADYSKVDIDTIRYGEVPVDKQIKLGQSDRRLDQGDRRLDQGDRRLDQGDVKLNETSRHNQATEAQAATNEAGRNERHDHPVARPPAAQASTVMTKYGVGQVSKDKTKMLIKRGDKYYLYLNAGQHGNQINWVPQGEVVPK